MQLIRSFLAFTGFSIALILVAGNVSAQQENNPGIIPSQNEILSETANMPTPVDTMAVTEATMNGRAYNPLIKPEEVKVSEIRSLFFSPDALALIRDAQDGLNTMTAMGGGVNNGNVKPGIRELSLGGLVYDSPEDWTIWLNSRRITPDTIPEQIFDLAVHEDYIDVKWYDRYTNRLYPIRLRPHERFHLDSRLFLVGTAPESEQLF